MSKEQTTELATQILALTKKSATDPIGQEVKTAVLIFVMDKTIHIIDFILDLVELLGLEHREWFKKLYLLVKIFCLQNT